MLLLDFGASFPNSHIFSEIEVLFGKTQLAWEFGCLFVLHPGFTFDQLVSDSHIQQALKVLVQQFYATSLGSTTHRFYR